MSIKSVTRISALIMALLISAPVLAQELGCGFSLIPEAQIKRGCGCGYHLRKGDGLRTLFQAGLNAPANPRMYLNGEIVALQAAPANAPINVTIQFLDQITGSCSDCL